MAITVFESRQQLSRLDVVAFRRGRRGQAALRAASAAWLRGMAPTISDAPLDIQALADLFAEQVTADAEGDLAKYFSLTQGAGVTPGGVPTSSVRWPVISQPRDVFPSATAIASIGEALAGWYCQREGLLPEARPVGDFPDMVFSDPTEERYFLIEVKATQGSTIDSQMRDAVMDLLDLVRDLLVVSDNPEYVCCSVGVLIRPNLDYELRIVRLAVR